MSSTGWSQALSGFKAEPKAGETHSGNRGLMIEEALLFEKEDDADEKVSSLVMEYGYLPGDVVAVAVEIKEAEE